MLRPVVIAVALACAGCASPASQDAPASSSVRADEPVASEPQAATESAPPANAASTPSNAGTYVVHFAPQPSRLPNNEPFELELWITRGDAPADDVALAVDAAMPEHGHGMVRSAVVERLGAGHFVARGMLLHMTGRWELYFDITRGAVTERAQITATLE